MPTRRARRRRIEAYVLVVVVAALGFWRQEKIVDRIDRESERSDLAICRSLNTGRETLRALIDKASQPLPGESPDEVNRAAEFRQFALERLQPIPCGKVVK